jgi:beta-lactamase regulating signal transducer with metallopeptidase domain
MRDFFYSSWSEVIGFSLIHSLWLGLIGIVIVILISRLVNQQYSALRYWLYVVIMMIVILVNAGMLIKTTTVSINPESVLYSKITSNQLPFSDTLLSNQLDQITTLATSFQMILPYFVMFWWTGMVFLFLRLSINLANAKKLARLDHVQVCEEINVIFEDIKDRLGVKKIVQLVQSRNVSVPCVVGYLKPLILLPIGLTSGLSNNQIEAILLHELSHIKRHDFLVNILQSVIEVIYFFNPFIWLISKFIRDEREHACDDAAIAQGISPKLYAQTLTGVFSHAINHQQLALSFASKNKLTLRRLQRIMKTQTNNNSNKLIATTVFVVAISLSMYFGAQPNAPIQNMAGIGPERALMAMSIPIFDTPKSNPKLEIPASRIELRNVIEVQTDTTDIEELEKSREEYEKAMNKLKSTREWKEFEKMSKEMAKEHAQLMKDMEPALEEAMRVAEKAMEFKEQELLVMEEKMEFLADQMADINIDFDEDFDFEFKTNAIKEAVQKMEMQLESLNLDELSEMSAKIAKETEAVAAEAEKLAVEANKYAEAVEEFLSEIKPKLISDGYIKSAKDLDSLKIEDGEVWVNGKKVSDKDAKKYIKTHQKYFDDKGFYMN